MGSGNKVAQRFFIVTVKGIKGNFAAKSGGGITSEVSKIWNGGDLTPDVIAGPPEVENVTVTRPFEMGRDDKLLSDYRKKVGSWTTDIVVTPADGNMTPTGSKTVYSGALLVGIKEPDADASSSDAATIELEFAISKVK